MLRSNFRSETRQMPLGLLTEGDKENVYRFIDNLEPVSRLENIRDAKTFIAGPSVDIHKQLSVIGQMGTDVASNILRVSTGTEHIDYMIANLDRRLKSIIEGVAREIVIR